MNNKKDKLDNVDNFSLDYSQIVDPDDLLNYQNLIKFNPEAIGTIINNYYSEENKITLLRNEEFISVIPDYILEMILNNMFFNSVFNMLQNKDIYDKITSIDVNISPKDYFLIPGYLDSENLIDKTSHLMLTDLLLNVDKIAVKEYLNKPYIFNKLTNNELITIASSNNINILELLITRNINDYDLITYINKMWQNKLDYSLIDNDYVKRNILKLSDKQIDSIDFNDIYYLFDRLNTYSVIAIQETPITINTFKSVLSSYLVLGLKDCLKFAETGSKNILMADVKKMANKVVDYELYLYKINNANTFDNITGKVLNELYKINQYHDLNDLINHSPYLRNIISLSRVYNYGDTISFLNDYLNYEAEYGNVAKVKLYKYFNGLTKHIYQNQKDFKKDQVNKSLLKHFKLRPATIFNHKNKMTKEYIKFLKLKVLINTLLNNNRVNYQELYQSNINVNNLVNMYIKSLGKQDISIKFILNNILIPLSNNEFSYENALLKFNYKIPNQFKLIIEEQKERKLINKLNKEIKKLLLNKNDNNKLNVLNYLCYGTELNNSENLKTWENIRNQILYLNGNVYVNKDDYNIAYQNNIIIDNIDNINNIKDLIRQIDLIIKHTYSFMNKVIDTSKIEIIYKEQIDNYINSRKTTYKFNSHNYEIKKNVFCLDNIERAFNEFDISKNLINNDDFKATFIENDFLAYAATGLFNEYFMPIGKIISLYPEYKVQNDHNIFNFIDWIRVNSLKKNPLYQALSCNTQNNLVYDDDKNLELYEKMLKKNYTSIPPIKGYINDSYYETCDFHSEHLLTNEYPESIRNPKLHEYLCTNKNACYINIFDKVTKTQIGTIAAIRNGNVIYLSKLSTSEQINDIDQIIKAISHNLIEKTLNSDEPIEFVILNTPNVDYFPSFIKVNEHTINNLNNPILYNKNIKDYNDENCLLIASNSILSKDNIKEYNPKTNYQRERNNYKIISNLASIEEINKINLMLYLSLKDKEQYKPLDINEFSEVIYGDDWLIIKSIDNSLNTININNSEEANNEIADYLNRVKEKVKSRKVA